MTTIPEAISVKPNTLDRLKITKEKATAGVLGAIAAVATTGQYNDYYWGYGVKAPDIVEAAMNSTGHPFVGFVGAVSAIALTNRPKRGLPRKKFLHKNAESDAQTTRRASRALATIQGGAIANFYVEGLQVIARHPTEENLFWNAPRETAKDYIFALAGAGLYLAISKSKNKNKT